MTRIQKIMLAPLVGLSVLMCSCRVRHVDIDTTGIDGVRVVRGLGSEQEQYTSRHPMLVKGICRVVSSATLDRASFLSWRPQMLLLLAGEETRFSFRSTDHILGEGHRVYVDQTGKLTPLIEEVMTGVRVELAPGQQSYHSREGVRLLVTLTNLSVAALLVPQRVPCQARHGVGDGKGFYFSDPEIDVFFDHDKSMMLALDETCVLSSAPILQDRLAPGEFMIDVGGLQLERPDGEALLLPRRYCKVTIE